MGPIDFLAFGDDDGEAAAFDEADGDREPEPLIERQLRRPGWTVSTWVKMSDGALWALPRMGFVEYLATPEIMRAVAEYLEKTAEDDKEPPNPLFPFALASLRMSRFVWSALPLLLALNYHLTPEQVAFKLPDGYEYLALTTAVIDLLCETSNSPEFPAGWQEHDGIMFDN